MHYNGYDTAAYALQWRPRRRASKLAAAHWPFMAAYAPRLYGHNCRKACNSAIQALFVVVVVVVVFIFFSMRIVFMTCGIARHKPIS